MIAPDHEHRFVPFRRLARPDGFTEIYSRCQCGGVSTPDNPTPETFERRHIVNEQTGEALGLHFRIGNVWVLPSDLVAYAQGLQACPECRGVDRGYPCRTCRGLGVVDAAGEWVAPPADYAGRVG